MDHVDRILAQWRANRTDLDVDAMEVFGRLNRLHAHLSQRIAAVLAENAFTPAGFDVMATLRRSGPPYALTVSELLDWTMVTSGTMTNRLDKLEESGLITRTRNPDDGRGFVVALTDAGLASVDAMATRHVANQHALIDPLTRDERAQLDALLAKWLAAFEPPKDD